MIVTPPTLDAPMEGRCLCGAVHVRVDAVTHGVGACHCRMCRRWSGAVFAVFTAPAEAVTVRGDVARHASSDHAERAFCPACGSHLWWRRTDRAGTGYDLMPGLFDGAEGWSLDSEIYVDRAPPYARLPGDHPTKTAAAYEAASPSVQGDSP